MFNKKSVASEHFNIILEFPKTVKLKQLDKAVRERLVQFYNDFGYAIGYGRVNSACRRGKK